MGRGMPGRNMPPVKEKDRRRQRWHQLQALVAVGPAYVVHPEEVSPAGCAALPAAGPAASPAYADGWAAGQAAARTAGNRAGRAVKRAAGPAAAWTAGEAAG